MNKKSKDPPSCHNENTSSEHTHHKPGKQRFDYLLWGSIFIIILSYIAYAIWAQKLDSINYFGTFTSTMFELMNQTWWGIALGIVFVGILAKVPREFVVSILGKGGTVNGILRASGAGLLLDLCSHGILLVGMKLYERGASPGQVAAFLISSPWNSFSLTLILWALVGFKWMMAFLLLSMVIAFISGIIFDKLVVWGKLPPNPNKVDLPQEFAFWSEAKKGIKQTKFTKNLFWEMGKDGLIGSRLVLRWIFFGYVLAGLVRAFINTETLTTFFGPTLAGLGLTLVVATILEVCSEGSTPIAADLLTRAKAPGNSFAFMMTGVSTDYTEILSLKETTKSWKMSIFLPIITLPQVILLGIILNQFSV